MSRQTLDFCKGWKFHKGELTHPPKKLTSKTGTCGGASNLTEDEGFIFRLHPYMAAKMRTDNANHLYNVAKTLADDWVEVSVPHDWNAGEPYAVPEEWEDRTEAIERGYRKGGVGYYRKKFSLSEEDAGKRIVIEFDGVMRDCTVWVNGCYMGSHLSGYSGFALELSEYLFYGEEGENVILVKVDTTLREGWWAEGAGIYRPVRLIALEPVHIARHGVFVYTEKVTGESARVRAAVRVKNDRDCVGSENGLTVRTEILDAAGTVAAAQELPIQVKAMEEESVDFCLDVPAPHLWGLSDPYLYTLRTTVLFDGEEKDRAETRFGIRSVAYTANGLFVNGEQTEIKGVCLHQDFAVVGNALTPDILRYRLQRIQAMGANCIRSAHNPATHELLDLCDEMGILMMNENRRFELTRESEEDLHDLVEGTRNHPSLFVWSLENEELMPTLPNGKRLLKRLVAMVHQMDPTRPCTVAGHFACRDEEYVKIPDIAGFNYDMGDSAAMREAVPSLLTMASEDSSFASTRGEYADDEEQGYCDCYDSGSYLMKLMMRQMGLKELPVGTLGGASSPNNLVYSWNQYQKNLHLGGLFVWTAFDYRGETFPWNWPAVTSQYGAMDLCGFAKDSFWYWKSLWTKEPLVHVLPHWNWTEGQEIQVDAYSNCDEVELFLNGESQGRQAHTPGMITSWKVTYTPGELLIRAYRNGQEAANDRIETSGETACIQTELIYEGETLCLYQLRALDANGRICPTAKEAFQVRCTGGQILGTGNGNPSWHGSERTPEGQLFNGYALVIVKKQTDAVPEIEAKIF